MKKTNLPPLPFTVRESSIVHRLDLTQCGDIDWIHPEGDGGHSEHKTHSPGQITYRNLCESEPILTITDARVQYGWSDGAETASCPGITTAASFPYRDGQPDSVSVPISTPAGYEITVAASDQDREFTFVCGAWCAVLSVCIQLSDTPAPIYENTVRAGWDHDTKIYTVRIPAENSLTATVQMQTKLHPNGNVTLQAAALSTQQTLSDFRTLLQEKLAQADLIELSFYQPAPADCLAEEMKRAHQMLLSEQTEEDWYQQLHRLTQAYEDCLSQKIPGAFVCQTNAQLVCSFGWEGDRSAPIAYLDGSYLLRDNQNRMVTFGVRDVGGKVKWYNAEGYLPCFVSEYTKDGLDIKIENFANRHVIDGNAFEIAYSRMTMTNRSESEQGLPRVCCKLVPLNAEAQQAQTIMPGQTIVRDYAIGADRFTGTYPYPQPEKIAACGSFDDNYAQMRDYWNQRLSALTQLDLPDKQLVNAYKAGHIYTMIIRDDIAGQKCLHVGEVGYDNMWDHDTIGIVSSLFTESDFMYAKDYLTALPAQLQYDDAKWKYSWPYALYLSKTGDIDFVRERFEIIKTHTHSIQTDRIDNGTGILKQTNAIDSLGYWLTDNWSALTGLTTYRYLCRQLYAADPQEQYLTEAAWAEEQYASLLAAVEQAQRQMRQTYDYPYLSIEMTVPTEQSARSDPRDANWASMFLFGRWGWDGYLFGADQANSEQISLIDDTYRHGFERRAEVSDSMYNFGGYPHGFYSSAYNAGYASTALRGEAYRDAGIKSYQFMIQNSMSGPFGWWEGAGYPNPDSQWDIPHASGGGGSCQHMWGQSTATKVLIDSLIAEKIDDKIMIGRGIPNEWLTAGQTISVQNHVVEKGKKIGYTLCTSDDGKTITVQFTGEATTLPFSIELIGLKNNIACVSGAAAVNEPDGIVTAAPGTTAVTITLRQPVAAE